MRPLDPEEIKRCSEFLLTRRQFGARDNALLLLQYLWGYRISEMLSLTVGDVFRPDWGVRDVVTVRRMNMKGGKRDGTHVGSRSIPMPKSAIPILERYAGVLQNTGYAAEDPLFASSTTGSPLTVNAACRAMRKMAKKLDMDRIGTHSCRKAFAKRVYERSGKDIMETKAALHHSNVATTQQYLHAGREAERIIRDS